MPRRRPAGLVASEIVSVLESANRVLSGHTIAKRLAERGEPVASSQTFRILDDLCGKGLVHRVEIANGYVSGPPNNEGNFICALCGSLTSIEIPSQFEEVANLARKHGMAPFRIMIEAAGVCKSCRHTEAGQTLSLVTPLRRAPLAATAGA